MGEILGKAWASLDGFGQEVGKHVGPVAGDAWKATTGFGQEVGRHVGEKSRQISEINIGNVHRNVTNWVQRHPHQTTYHVLSAVSLLAPGLVTVPLLGVLGWTTIGPRAASIAAGLQGAVVPAGGVYATLQSAAMGGYGAPVVAGAARLTVGVGTAIGVLLPKPFDESGEVSPSEESEEGDTSEGEPMVEVDMHSEAV